MVWNKEINRLALCQQAAVAPHLQVASGFRMLHHVFVSERECAHDDRNEGFTFLTVILGRSFSTLEKHNGWLRQEERTSGKGKSEAEKELIDCLKELVSCGRGGFFKLLFFKYLLS